jgi:hypothetical protein
MICCDLHWSCDAGDVSNPSGRTHQSGRQVTCRPDFIKALIGVVRPDSLSIFVGPRWADSRVATELKLSGHDRDLDAAQWGSQIPPGAHRRAGHHL